ncbi:uncharacterized protein LOC102607480 [Citrus sinensis]|uniref:uncharacterized protein LOC102607480 n=1 Tax=Citrus sinensis TaxID=2711 RepID=UPI0022786EE5|nr:uncharacterized protein LOC102607480 [Citrus sinensis]
MPFSSYLSKFPLYLPRPHGSRFESDVYVNSWDPTISKLLVSISTLCNQRKMYLLRSDVKSGRRNELKHGKAVVLRKGLFRDIKNSTGPYGGEALAATQESVKARDSKIRCMAELNFCS